MKINKTDRGFERIDFVDGDGADCSLQQSSKAIYSTPGTGAIWFGVGEHRMHITYEQMKKEIMPHLSNWVKSGSFMETNHTNDKDKTTLRQDLIDYYAWECQGNSFYTLNEIESRVDTYLKQLEKLTKYIEE